MDAYGMNRREALHALTVAGAGAATLPLWVASLTARAHTHCETIRQAADLAVGSAVLTTEQYETVDVLTELIIPETDTAGARRAQVTAFIDTVLEDAAPSERDNFLNGLAWVDERANELFGAVFKDTTPEQQHALLTILGSEENQTPADRVGVEFFLAAKQLTVTGYYTSRVGMLQELDDDGSRYFDDKPGCQHPEHRGGN